MENNQKMTKKSNTNTNMNKNKNKKTNKKRQTQLIEKIVFESDPELSLNESQKIQNKLNNIKRQINNLYKVYDREIIDQDQYAAGERLLFDYENSFKNKCTTTTLEEVKVQKSTKMNNEFHLIQNLNSWDKYNKAISSLEDLNTREIVKQFVIENKSLTQIDKQLKKQGVAEVRLWYGLKELAEYYRNLNRINKDKI